MTLLVDAEQFATRRQVARGPLRPLAESLVADFQAVVGRPLYVPEQKALLSREGGRCPRDGVMLDFDPFSPQAHRCPRCGETYRGELHDRFWVYWYQLWLAERCLHGALLGALGAEPRGTAFAVSVLDVYADRYLTYPNVDNALGPTRPFFSTYLESIWLLQLCVAVDLLGDAATSVRHRFFDRVLEPSRKLIASFDEGMSNRQVWNNAALIASAMLLDRPDDVDAPMWGESGLAMHLTEGLLPDGTWYEGENYHLFTHRGLWYGVAMAECLGVELPSVLLDRFDRAFVTPFLTALPDYTLPSRRDSQYAISLRQWRFAEMCELGLARRDDAILVGALKRLYEDEVPRSPTGRAASAADVERNLSPTRLDRADLNWKSLLFAKPDLPPLVPAAPPSTLLESQGIGVIRRDAGRVFVALDYGHTGGGHGHPDRLNLLLMDGSTRWLDDYGTGSYVDRSLHWYRSTLAHNAPFSGGRSQPRVPGHLHAFEDRGGAGWISASARIGASAVARRTLIALPDYLVDEIDVAGEGGGFDLPLHVDAHYEAEDRTSVVVAGGKGLEDGFDFVHTATRILALKPGEAASLEALGDGRELDLWVAASVPLEIIRCVAPGPPTKGDARFILLRSAFAKGTIRLVWSWEGAVDDAILFPSVTVDLAKSRHELSWDTERSSIVIHTGGAKSTIDLAGAAPNDRGPTTDSALEEFTERALVDEDGDTVRAVVVRPGLPNRFVLGQESYSFTEDDWSQAGQPVAEVSIGNEKGKLSLSVDVRNVARTFAEETAANDLDNEAADINGAGVQLYLRTDQGSAGYVLVPELDSTKVRGRPIQGWGDGIPVSARWSATETGYRLDVDVDAPGNDQVIDLDVLVNEKPEGRRRRRGQLALSGGGEFIYLRGDRHDADRLIPFLLTDA